MKINEELIQYRGVIPSEIRLHSQYDMNEEFNKFIIHSKYFQAHNLCIAFLRNICQLKAVAKGWRPGISPGYYGHDPWALSTSKRNSQMFNFLPTDCIYPGT